MLLGSLALPPPRVTPEPHAKRLITPVAVSPSARAANVSAMRCLSTGSASAMTSSTDGASRPSISALARTASISAWLARGPGPQAISRSVSAPAPVPGRAERASFRIASTTLSGTGSWRTRRWMAISSGPVRICSTRRSSVPVVANSMRRSAPWSG